MRLLLSHAFDKYIIWQDEADLGKLDSHLNYAILRKFSGKFNYHKTY